MKISEHGLTYSPFLIGLDEDQSSLLSITQLECVKTHCSVIGHGRSNRFPVFYNPSTGERFGGFYPALSSKTETLKFYDAFKQEAQKQGYIETKQGRYGQSINPFKTDLCNGIPRHVWAYSYEAGSRAFRSTRRLTELKRGTKNEF
ncbi:hypothetical protein OKZ62_001898 [Vibrio navarrensis]|nr:hypothetical protein [Vibrio navarrensis]